MSFDFLSSPFFSRVGLFLTELPTGLEVGFFFLIWGLLWLPMAVPLVIALQWRPPKPLEIRQKLPLVASLYVLAPFVLWSFARLQQLPFATFGWSWDRHVLNSFALGLEIGAIGLLLLFGLQTLLGWITWKAQSWRSVVTAITVSLLIGVAIGGIEELVFRGFVFGQLLQAYDFWTGAIASSLIFAMLHLVWEGTENIPQLPGLSLMGVVLCLAVSFKSGQPELGLAWGLHAGWIWAMASLDAVEYTGRAPDWLTGLDDKPLAGFMGLGFLLATAGVVLAL